MPRRPRRRAFRASDAVDYDRTADRPDPMLSEEGVPGDSDERVVLDEGEAEEIDDESGDRLLDERPPHYGPGE